MTPEEKLFKWAESNRLNDRDISRHTGLAPDMISRMRRLLRGQKEGSRRLTNINHFTRISRATGLSIDYLLDESQGWPPPAVAARKSPPLAEGDRQMIERLAEELGFSEAFRRLVHGSATPTHSEQARPPAKMDDLSPPDNGIVVRRRARQAE